MVVPRLYINKFEGFLDYTYVGKPYILDWNGIGIWIPVLLLVLCYNPLRLRETDLKLILQPKPLASLAFWKGVR